MVERIRTIAKKNRRRGYRLAHQQLRREGLKVNHKRIHRLWRREGLSVRPRRSRKRIRGQKPVEKSMATAPNTTWCLDFVEDRTLDGRKLRILCIEDQYRGGTLLQVREGLPDPGATLCSARYAWCALHGQRTLPFGWVPGVRRHGLAGAVLPQRHQRGLH